MVTFVLVVTCFANFEPKRVDMESMSLPIGLSICLGHFFAVSISMSIKNIKLVYMTKQETQEAKKQKRAHLKAVKSFEINKVGQTYILIINHHHLPLMNWQCQL